MKKLLFIPAFFSFALVFGGNSDSLLRVLNNITANDTNKVWALNNLAIALEEKGNLVSSKSYLLNSIQLCDSLRFKRGLAFGYNWLAIVIREMGDYAKATEYELKSLKLNTELKDITGTARCYLSLGNIDIAMGDFVSGKKNFNTALQLALEIKNPDVVATCNANAAICYHALQQMDSAEYFYLKSIRYYEKIGASFDQAAQYTNFGLFKLDQKKHKEALNYLFKALEMQQRVFDTIHIAGVLNNIGEVYLDMKDYAKGVYYFNEGYLLSVKTESKYDMFNAFVSLAHGYQLSGNYQKALYFLERSQDLKDTLMNTESTKNIKEMQTRFESDKKEKEIELLQKDKNIRELQIAGQQANINRQRIIIYSVIAGLVLVVILIFFILKSYREKKKINVGLERKNIEINIQKNLIEEKNLLITDSIDYAQKIQEAVLPSDALIKKYIPDSFILFLPKDIVSGDFYFVLPHKDLLFIACADCTGHGVPGAFMSVMALNMLENIISGKNLLQPALILDELNKTVLETLRQDTENSSAKYGMDISLITLDKLKNRVQFAGAHNSLCLVRNKVLTEIKADKTAIGMAKEKFTSHTVEIQKGDMVYIYTDGYADQKGGPQNKKRFSSELKELLVSVSAQNSAEQKEMLGRAFFDWKAGNDQIDDVLVMGIRF